MRSAIRRTGAQRGQAAVETAATATVVALLLAVATAWLVATLRPPPAPPDVIGRVAAPVVAPAASAVPAIAPPRSLAAILGVPEGSHPSQPLGRALRAVAEGVVVAVRAREAFHDGMRERAVERFREILHDPVGELTTLPDPSLATPQGLARALAATAVQRAEALRDYVRRLRGMPVSEAIVTVSHDAGRETTDVAIRVAEAWLRRRALGGRPAPAPRPAPPRQP